MKLVGLSGSGRYNSFNTMILKYLKEKFKNDIEIEIIDLKHLPLYNQDIEENTYEEVEYLREKIREADGLIFATPEHNQSIPAILKNAIDWMSRVDPVLAGKPALLMGATPGGLGTVMAQAHLRDILNLLNVRVQPGVGVFISNIFSKIDEEGRLNDKATMEHLDASLLGFKDWVKKF